MNTIRQIDTLFHPHATTDGDGVSIMRTATARLDPFLMLDELHSSTPLVNGFPSHPHRGIETLTYMRQGGFEHRDHMGNHGIVGANSAQWLSAARGVIHSEMPVASDDGLHGFQLWINLPAARKMQAPAYRQVDGLPQYQLRDGLISAVAGEWQIGKQILTSPLNELAAQARVLCVELHARAMVDIAVDDAETVLLYPFAGELANPTLAQRVLADTTPGNVLALRAGNQGVKLLVLAGVPIGEPVVQYGPFVMNSREEIDQALRNYRDGTLAY